jgi:AcrR family transcriptional regulator
VTELDLDRGTIPGKRERNKAEKRMRIVAAARELFQTRGFEETTTAEISEKAGIGAGTLYLYVDSKEELLIEVFRDEIGQVWEEAFARCDRSQPLLDQLLQIFGHLSAYHAQDPKLARSCFKELTFFAERETNAAAEFIRGYYQRLAGLLTEAQEAGKLDPQVPTPVLARNLFSFWYHLMRSRYADRITEADVESGLRKSFGVALLGLTPPS